MCDPTILNIQKVWFDSQKFRHRKVVGFFQDWQAAAVVNLAGGIFFISSGKPMTQKVTPVVKLDEVFYKPQVTRSWGKNRGFCYPMTPSKSVRETDPYAIVEDPEQQAMIVGRILRDVAPLLARHVILAGNDLLELQVPCLWEHYALQITYESSKEYKVAEDLMFKGIPNSFDAVITGPNELSVEIPKTSKIWADKLDEGVYKINTKFSEILATRGQSGWVIREKVLR